MEEVPGQYLYLVWVMGELNLCVNAKFREKLHKEDLANVPNV